MKRFLILLSMILFWSCSSSYKLKRAQKHIDRAVEINPDVLKADTIIINDTIVTERRTFDTTTLLRNLYEIDTVFLTDTVTQVKVELMREKEYLRVKADCPPDSILIRDSIEVEKIEYINNIDDINRLERKLNRLNTFLIISLLLNIILLIALILKR